MSTLSLLASSAMAVGAPLIYADQFYSIQKKRSAVGFSKDVCAVLLLANLARCFWWLRVHFELPLLVQSVLMILAQLGLLGLLLKYREGSFASRAYTSSSEDYYAHGRDPAGLVSSGTAAGTGTGGRRSRVQGQGERESLRSSSPLRPTILPSTTTATGTGTGTGTATAPATSNVRNEGGARIADAGFASLFSGPTRGGGYTPILSGLHLPQLPLLDSSSLPVHTHEEEEEEEEEDVEPTSLLTRLSRRAAKVAKKTSVRLKTLVGVRTDGSLRQDGSSSGRPFGFWTWTTMSSYVVFLLLYSLLLLLLHLLFLTSSTYSTLLGLYALGLESTLPLPQFLSNQARRSLSGFRLSVLAGWVVGDVFKTAYFLLNASPFPFLLAALFSLSVDCGILVQSRWFKDQTEKEEREEEERKRIQEALLLEEEAEARRMAGGGGGDGGDGGMDPLDVTSRRRRDEELDQDLEEDFDADPVLFDSNMNMNSAKDHSATGPHPHHLGKGGNTVSSTSKVFTIEADEE